MMSVNLKLSIGVEGTSGREDSGDDQHQGKSALKCKNVYDVVQINYIEWLNEKSLKYNMCMRYS